MLAFITSITLWIWSEGEFSWQVSLHDSLCPAGPTASDPPQATSEELLPPSPTTVQWERDRYILALISIMVPKDQLAALGEVLGLTPLTIDQVMADHAPGSKVGDNVGEGAYEMLKRASGSQQPLTFGKILVGLSEIDRSDDLVPILRSYVQSRLLVQSLSRASSGTPAEAKSTGDPSALFVAWLHDNHPTLIPRATGVGIERVIQPEEQVPLFSDLSQKIVCVWRMVGRLLGLPDWEIDKVNIECRGQHDGVRKSCSRILLRWVDHSQRPEDITYGRLLTALELTSLGVGAALDAIHYLYHFTLDLEI